MKKRIPAFLLFLPLLLSCVLLPAGAEEALPGFTRSSSYSAFSDVPSGAWYETYVQTAAEYGILAGVGNGQYAPTGQVTVAQAIKIAASLHAIYQTGRADFPAGEPWYQPYVDYARAQGLVTRTFPDYNAPATRLQIAEIFVSALPEAALEMKNTVVDNAIPDVLTGSEGAAAVYQLYRAGILQGSDNRHSYRPETSVQRSEISAVVTRLILPEQRLSFEIRRPYTPPAPAVTGMEVKTYLSATVQWQPVEGAEGYSFCLSNRADGEYQYLSRVSDPATTTRTISVDALGTYYLRIASYRTVGGELLVGEYSEPYKMVVTVPGESAYAAARGQARDYLETLSQRWGWGELQYSYYDMDGNGIPEMFIRCTNYPDNIAALYTYRDYAICLYINDFSHELGQDEYYFWSCSLLKSGVVSFDMVKQTYDCYDKLQRDVIGMDFLRLSGEKDSLVLAESVVYDGSLSGRYFYQSSSNSSRSYLSGSRTGFRTVSESYFLSLYRDYGSYGSPVQIASWDWKSF